MFAINQDTGEPTLIQNIDGKGIQLRTFGIEPSARMLIAASIQPLPLREGGRLTAGLTVFRIGSDGKLASRASTMSTPAVTSSSGAGWSRWRDGGPGCSAMTLIINNADVAKVLTMETTLAALEEAYLELAAKEAVCRPRIDIRIPTSDPAKNYQWGTMEGGSTAGYFAIRMKSDIIYESRYNGVDHAGEILHATGPLLRADAAHLGRDRRAARLHQ